MCTKHAFVFTKKVIICSFGYSVQKFTLCMLSFTGMFCDISINSEFRKYGLEFIAMFRAML